MDGNARSLCLASSDEPSSAVSAAATENSVTQTTTNSGKTNSPSRGSSRLKKKVNFAVDVLLTEVSRRLTFLSLFSLVVVSDGAQTVQPYAPLARGGETSFQQRAEDEARGTGKSKTWSCYTSLWDIVYYYSLRMIVYFFPILKIVRVFISWLCIYYTHICPISKFYILSWYISLCLQLSRERREWEEEEAKREIRKKQRFKVYRPCVFILTHPVLSGTISHYCWQIHKL